MPYFCTLNTLPQVTYLNHFVSKGEWVHFRRQSNEYILYFMTEGNLYLREEEREYSLKAGDVILLQPGLTHEGIKPAKCAYYYVHFSNLSLLPFELADSLVNPAETEKRDNPFLSDFCVIPKFLRLGAKADKEYLAACFKEAAVFRREGQICCHAFWGSKLLEILLRISSVNRSAALADRESPLPARSTKRIEELIEYLNSHYSEKIVGKQLEEMLGMNFDYINRIFRKAMGQTVFQYLTRIRINRVKELLVTSDMKLAEIAVETGFSDEFYLSRQFKKLVGVSPVAYTKGISRG